MFVKSLITISIKTYLFLNKDLNKYVELIMTDIITTVITIIINRLTVDIPSKKIFEMYLTL